MDSIYFFDKFKTEFFSYLENDLKTRKDLLVRGKVDFNEYIKLRGQIEATEGIMHIFTQIENKMKDYAN